MTTPLEHALAADPFAADRDRLIGEFAVSEHELARTVAAMCPVDSTPPLVKRATSRSLLPLPPRPLPPPPPLTAATLARARTRRDAVWRRSVEETEATFR